MNENKNLKKGLGIHARRFIAYVVLILVTFACLFWFYVLFINATRSNGELQAGFTPLPSTHLLENWYNLVKCMELTGAVNSGSLDQRYRQCTFHILLHVKECYRSSDRWHDQWNECIFHM